MSSAPPFTHASLCSGFGAAELAAVWMGWENAFWCEVNPFCRSILEYWFENSTGYGNIKETDFRRWRGQIDVLTAGFPCQPFSNAALYVAEMMGFPTAWTVLPFLRGEEKASKDSETR
jgi:site-specific DNA-cytosine methylase